MINFWEINSKILQERFPGLLEELINAKNDFNEKDIKTETAITGEPTITVKGIYVHSQRDPVREGKRLAETCLAEKREAAAGEAENTSSQPVIIFGFGLGYSAEAAAELAPKRPLIVVEKNTSVLRKAFELRDLSKFLLKNGIAFVPGGTGEGISKALSFFESEFAPIILRNRTLTDIEEEWYSAAENRVRTWAMRNDINSATLKKFGKRWIRNLSCNMTAIRDLPGISHIALQNEYSKNEAMEKNSPPVFLAAAGPGLDNIVSLLPEIYKRCIIVAVDTSHCFLSRNNINPDYTLTVDPQFWNSRHLNRCLCSGTRLIAESAAYPSVFRFPFKAVYLCGSLFPLGKFIENKVDPKGTLGAGGSVATTAWDFCRMLGACEIWIAGLDLSYPGLKTHFRGAQFEEKMLSESDRFNPGETWLYHALRDGIPFKAQSMNGEQVLTDRRLSLYAAWFENRFRQFPNIKNYCFTSGNTKQSGLYITGMEPANPEKFLKLPERRNEINNKLETVHERIKTDFFEANETLLRNNRFNEAVTQLNTGLKKIKTACHAGLKIINHALPQNFNQKEQEKILFALDEINNAITGSEVKEIAGFLFPGDALSGSNKSGSNNASDSFRNYLESSSRLYSSLIESATINL